MTAGRGVMTTLFLLEMGRFLLQVKRGRTRAVCGWAGSYDEIRLLYSIVYSYVQYHVLGMTGGQHQITRAANILVVF